jgi:hypothetical protein
MPKLTTLADTKAKNAKPREKEYSLSAGKGLHLRVSPTGTKTWLFNYIKPHTRKRSNLSVGQYPAVSLADATAVRDKHRALLAKQINPQEQAKASRDALTKTMAETFDAVYRSWLTVKRSRLSDVYLHRIDAAMVLHVLPELGGRPLYPLANIKSALRRRSRRTTQP